MKCKAHNDVPYTNSATGMVFWKEEPCKSQAKPGRSFCMWHDRPDFLPPEIIEQLIRNAGKPNASS